MCRALKKTLEERKGSEQIAFVDISSPRYDPAENADVTFDDAMATIHVVEREGNAITTGLDALQKLFEIADENHDGSISREELENALKKLGFSHLKDA